MILSAVFTFQKLLKDIEGHRNRADIVLQKHAELRSSLGDVSPSHGQNLVNEISNLEKMAEEQYEHLQRAVAQQDQCDSDIRHLTAAIDDAQEKLMTSPSDASTVEGLKKQIAEQNVCIYNRCILGDY